MGPGLVRTENFGLAQRSTIVCLSRTQPCFSSATRNPLSTQQHLPLLNMGIGFVKQIIRQSVLRPSVHAGKLHVRKVPVSAETRDGVLLRWLLQKRGTEADGRPAAEEATRACHPIGQTEWLVPSRPISVARYSGHLHAWLAEGQPPLLAWNGARFGVLGCNHHPKAAVADVRPLLDAQRTQGHDTKDQPQKWQRMEVHGTEGAHPGTGFAKFVRSL